MNRIAELRVKINSLAAECRIIRQAEQTFGRRISRRVRAEKPFSGLERTLESLHYHRTVDIRREARAAQMASGYLRGKAYRDMEQSAKAAPDWDRVLGNVKRFGDSAALTGYARWRDNAIASFAITVE